MTVILLLLHLTSSVCGESAEKTTFYQAEEEDNITIRWDSQNQTDLSLTNIICFLLSKPLKVLYELIDGVELPESQHQQFSGRVQCDRDALREGRVTLHLSRLMAEDSGSYRCKMIHYNKNLRRWELQGQIHFVLNVIQTSLMSPSTSTPGLVIIQGAQHPMDGQLIGVKLLIFAVVVLIFGVLLCVGGTVYNDRQRTAIDERARVRERVLIELLIQVANVNHLHDADP